MQTDFKQLLIDLNKVYKSYPRLSKVLNVPLGTMKKILYMGTKEIYYSTAMKIINLHKRHFDEK